MQQKSTKDSHIIANWKKNQFIIINSPARIRSQFDLPSGTDFHWTDESDLQFAPVDNELQPSFGAEVLEQSGDLRGIAFEKGKQSYIFR